MQGNVLTRFTRNLCKGGFGVCVCSDPTRWTTGKNPKKTHDAGRQEGCLERNDAGTLFNFVSTPRLLLGAQDQRLGDGATSTSLWVHGNLFRQLERQKPVIMVRACHTPRQPLQNQSSRHLGGWATPWSAEEMPMPEPSTVASLQETLK